MFLLFQMVYKYKRSTNRQGWSNLSMEEAVNAVVRGEMGYHRASSQFNVPQTTLERYVKKRRSNPNEENLSTTLGRYKTVFLPRQEEEIASYLRDMEGRLFGLTMTECRKLAFQLAELNNINHPFSKTSQMAGKGWMQGFLRRHPELSIRKPEATSGMRARGFNEVAVSKFFTLLEELVEKYHFTAQQIYNVDETGITVVPKSASKIIAIKGKRQVGALTSAERGELVTAEICFSASGSYMPPLLIYPRKKMQQGFLDGLVPGAWVELNQKGWIDMEIFFKWFKKFVEFSKASKDTPVLLLLDGHSSHTKNLNLINYARDNGVVLLCFPPHSTHRLQPLDVAFMKPLSVYFEDEVRRWLRTNPGRVATLHQLSTLFSAAFIRAATMPTAINGFRKTGIWPVNASVFSDADFLPSAATEVEDESAVDCQAEPSNNISDVRKGNSNNNSCTAIEQHRSDNNTSPIFLTSKATIPVGEKTPEKIETNSAIEPQPSTSRMNDSSFPLSSPTAIIPIPQTRQTVKRVRRKKGKTVILTSTPYKDELEESVEAKNKKTLRQIAVKRKIEDPGGSKKTKKGNKKKSKLIAKDDSSDSEVSHDSDAECLYCGDLYSISSEGWIACSMCLRWAHNSCAGVDDEDSEATLICEFCS